MQQQDAPACTTHHPQMHPAPQIDTRHLPIDLRMESPNAVHNNAGESTGYDATSSNMANAPRLNVCPQSPSPTMRSNRVNSAPHEPQTTSISNHQHQQQQKHNKGTNNREQNHRSEKSHTNHHQLQQKPTSTTTKASPFPPFPPFPRTHSVVHPSFVFNLSYLLRSPPRHGPPRSILVESIGQKHSLRPRLLRSH